MSMRWQGPFLENSRKILKREPLLHTSVSLTCSNLIASFGGLLMKLRGDTKILADIDLDARIYLLIRKLK